MLDPNGDQVGVEREELLSMLRGMQRGEVLTFQLWQTDSIDHRCGGCAGHVGRVRADDPEWRHERLAVA